MKNLLLYCFFTLSFCMEPEPKKEEPRVGFRLLNKFVKVSRCDKKGDKYYENVILTLQGKPNKTSEELNSLSQAQFFLQRYTESHETAIKTLSLEPNNENSNYRLIRTTIKLMKTKEEIDKYFLQYLRIVSNQEANYTMFDQQSFPKCEKLDFTKLFFCYMDLIKYCVQKEETLLIQVLSNFFCNLSPNYDSYIDSFTSFLFESGYLRNKNRLSYKNKLKLFTNLCEVMKNHKFRTKIDQQYSLMLIISLLFRANCLLENKTKLAENLFNAIEKIQLLNSKLASNFGNYYFHQADNFNKAILYYKIAVLNTEEEIPYATYNFLLLLLDILQNNKEIEEYISDKEIDSLTEKSEQSIKNKEMYKDDPTYPQDTFKLFSNLHKLIVSNKRKELKKYETEEEKEKFSQLSETEQTQIQEEYQKFLEKIEEYEKYEMEFEENASKNFVKVIDEEKTTAAVTNRTCLRTPRTT